MREDESEWREKGDEVTKVNGLERILQVRSLVNLPGQG